MLVAAAVIGLIWANLPGAAGSSYETLRHLHINLGVGAVGISESVEGWINDGLMTVFFFVVGLEIKRELVSGELRDRKAAALPAIAALGGMVVPALIYFAFNAGGVGAAGWGIPMATDIAFVVGVVALLSKRIPPGVKLFLLTLAIVDDIGAIIVIAFFYTDNLAPLWLVPAAAGCLSMVVLARLHVRFTVVYLAIGVAVWFCAFQSGVHPTIAGVVIGLLTPERPIGGRVVVEELEHTLHPWASFAIVPVFALVNAGVPIDGGSLAAAFTSPVTWGIIAGLLVGKAVGICLFTAGGLRSGIGRPPAGTSKRQIYSASVLGGIGFTVSLFVAGLTFQTGAESVLLDNAKIGILAASILSALAGAALSFYPNRTPYTIVAQ